MNAEAAGKGSNCTLVELKLGVLSVVVIAAMF